MKKDPFQRLTTRYFMSVLLMIFMCVSCGYHYLDYQLQVEKNRVASNNLTAEYKEIRWETINSIIGVLNREGHIYSKLVAHILRRDIENSYPNLEVLKKSFEEGDHADKKFSSIILNTVHNSSFLFNPSGRNGVIVMCGDRVLYNLMVPSKKFDAKLSEFIDNQYNQDLAYATFNSISRFNFDVKFLEPHEPYKSDFVKNHTKISTSSLEEIRQVYMREGLLGLSGYVMVSPYYLTESGDLFGVPDFDINGIKTSNHKMMILSYVSIYDIIYTYHINRLNVIDKLEHEALQRNKLELVELYNSSIKSMLLHIFFIIAVLLATKSIQKDE